jgi:hypothetical protein
LNLCIQGAKLPKPNAGPAPGIIAAIYGTKGRISFGIIFLILLRIFEKNPILSSYYIIEKQGRNSCM